MIKKRHEFKVSSICTRQGYLNLIQFIRHGTYKVTNNIGPVSLKGRNSDLYFDHANISHTHTHSNSNTNTRIKSGSSDNIIDGHNYDPPKRPNGFFASIFGSNGNRRVYTNKRSSNDEEEDKKVDKDHNYDKAMNTNDSSNNSNSVGIYDKCDMNTTRRHHTCTTMSV